MDLSGKRKGVEGPLWTTMAMIAIIATFAVLILLIARGPLGAIFSSFCEQFPAVCGQTGPIEREQYVKAENSLRALTCAVESVGTGKFMCSEEYADPTEVNKLVEQGKDSNYNDMGPVVECEREFECGYIAGGNCYSTDYIKVKAFDKKNAKELCQERYDAERMHVFAFEKCIKEGEGSFNQCRVRNLQLPQTVSSAEDWIIFYGDPKFVVYYQAFPLTRDTWSYEPDWKTQVAITILSAFPPTMLAASLAKAGASFGLKLITQTIKQGGKEVVEEAITTTARQGERIVFRYVTKELGEEVVHVAGKQTFKSAMLRGFADFLKNRFLTKKGIIRVVTKAGVLEGAAQVAAALERSMMTKFEPHGNSMILKSPYDEPMVVELPKEMEGKPVMISWKPGVVAWRIDSAHLVSPCLVHDAVIESKRMQCKNEYIYRAKTKEVYCSGPHWDRGGNEPECNLAAYTNSEDPYLTNIERIMQTTVEEEIQHLRDLGLTVWEQDIQVKENAEYMENAFDVRWANIEFPKRGAEEYKGLKIKTRISGRNLYFDDWDDDGYFDTYAMENCVTDSVNILFDEWSRNHPKTKNEHNYCLDTRSWIDEIKQFGGLGSTVVGITLAGIAVTFIPGAGWIAGPAVIAGSLGGASLEIWGAYGEYKQYWPGYKY